jgi:hypothetical protein
MKDIRKLVPYKTSTVSHIIIEWERSKMSFRCDNENLVKEVGEYIKKYENEGVDFTVRKETLTIEHLYKYEKESHCK